MLTKSQLDHYLTTLDITPSDIQKKWCKHDNAVTPAADASVPLSLSKPIDGAA